MSGGEGVTPPTAGLMMDFPLTTAHFLWRMANVVGDSTVTSVHDADGTSTIRRFAEVAQRARGLAAGLHHLGIQPGDRVGTFAWNSAEHMEAYLAVTAMGAVLHTINLRLHADQLRWMIGHAGDRAIIVDESLWPVLSPVLDTLPQVEHVIIIGDVGESGDPRLHRYSDVISHPDADYRFPDIDERSAAALCYTSGTTGNPKGVSYSHRSIAIHALIMSGADVFGIRSDDVVLATVPMFHAMGWGLPFLSAMSGADVVMPGRNLAPASLLRMIRDNGVSWSSGVPTIWSEVATHVGEHPERAADLTSLRLLILGGTVVPADLIRRFRREFDVDVISGWGMTEIFPGATVARVDRDDVTAGAVARRAIAGRISPFYEIRLVDSDGHVVVHDGTARGEVQVRGPAVASGYFGSSLVEAADTFDEGWLRTGDVGTVDPRGWLAIVDRAKDMIKSGGEWISSADLETALLDHRDVVEAAVVGAPDERWGERPHAFLVVSACAPAALEQQLRALLAQRCPRWWVPDRFEIVESIPRTTTGKPDKKALRSALGR
jgi:fatty-acyl-CoA synthase